MSATSLRLYKLICSRLLPQACMQATLHLFPDHAASNPWIPLERVSQPALIDAIHWFHRPSACFSLIIAQGLALGNLIHVMVAHAARGGGQAFGKILMILGCGCSTRSLAPADTVAARGSRGLAHPAIQDGSLHPWGSVQTFNSALVGTMTWIAIAQSLATCIHCMHQAKHTQGMDDLSFCILFTWKITWKICISQQHMQPCTTFISSHRFLLSAMLENAD